MDSTLKKENQIPLSEEEIRKLDFLACDDILQDHGISYDNLETEEELQDLIILKLKRGQSSKSECREDQPKQTHSTEVIGKIIVKDKEIKDAIHDIYKILKEFFKGANFENDGKLIEELETEFRDFAESVDKNSRKLVNEECPIVVAGETSAGKTSLLNLLLGNDILPHSTLACTSTICRLRNSAEKKIEVTHRNGSKIQNVRILQQDTEKDLREKLMPLLSPPDKEKRNEYSYVDVYWPIPLLSANDKVIIVDTPGTGENDELTRCLIDYLPNAVAFIYVINSSNAGGTYRLLEIISEQKSWYAEGKNLQTFNPSCAIFVCNKWDQVPVDEQDKVWQDTLTKLKEWPEFKTSQIFKLSATENSRRSVSGLLYKEDFVDLLKGIEKLIPASLENRTKEHLVWLDRLVKTLLYHITARINNTRLNQQEKIEKKKVIEERLDSLKYRTEEVKVKLTKMAKRKCEELSQQLHDHLNSERCFSKIFNWDEKELPNGNDFDVIKYQANILVQKAIDKEVQGWSKENSIDKIKNDLMTEFRKEYRVIENECSAINCFMTDIGNPIDYKGLAGNHETESINESHGPLFTKGEKVALALVSPLWIPLMALAVGIAAPIGGVIAIKDKIREKKAVEQYMADKQSFMFTLARSTLETYTRETILDKLESTFLQKLSENLNELCENLIPRQIDSDKKLIENIQAEIRDSEEVRRYYGPMELEAKSIAGQILFLELEYFDNSVIPRENICEIETIGRGCFGRVYKATVHDVSEEVAVKSLHDPLNNRNTYFQLSEIKTLMSCQHENIVCLLGVSYERKGEEKYLLMVMELCDCDLHKLIKTKALPLGSDFKTGDPGYPEALSRFIRVAIDIISGICFIHNKMKSIHRDLKLSNILMKGERAKIADVGFTKESLLVTGSVVGTPTHMAPEVLQGELYDSKVDIYGFGILLWEIWYGRNVYEGMFNSPQELSTHIISGRHRPQFRTSNAPPSGIQTLMKGCWEHDPRYRPNCDKVLEKLFSVKQERL